MRGTFESMGTRTHVVVCPRERMRLHVATYPLLEIGPDVRVCPHKAENHILVQRLMVYSYVKACAPHVGIYLNTYGDREHVRSINFNLSTVFQHPTHSEIYSREE